ncbi:phage baseplate assembly protein [Gluconacetobacter sp.]|uniref:phage baseplate assembly protein n=1 Tax=Gluconacetobacter sp. TaxID=1935994 RepID=UPI0039E874BE
MSDTTVAVATRPMVVRVNGRVLGTWSVCQVVFDLSYISGSFRVDLLDEARADAALQTARTDWAPIRKRMPVSIDVAGDTVLKGWVEDLHLHLDDNGITASIAGRDPTGDLVDCSANPMGPAEYRMISLEDAVTAICAPFGISVTKDCDTGAPFNVVAIDPGEPAMATIEKLCRQRGVLATSNGVGGLILTQAGTSRAPEPLRMPGNARAVEVEESSRGEYSDIWVKGQFNSLLRPAKATLDATAAPLSATPGAPPAAPTHTAQESQAIVRYGHAVNPVMTRYRPRVWLAATQSGGSVATQQATDQPLDSTARGLTADPGPAPAAYHAAKRKPRRKASKPRTDATPWTLQDQADWRMRTTRAAGDRRTYLVPSLTASTGKRWLANQLVAVTDRYADIDQDMLIASVAWTASQEGYRTDCGVVDPDAYDLTGDMDHTHNGRRKAVHVRAIDGTAG